MLGEVERFGARDEFGFLDFTGSLDRFQLLARFEDTLDERGEWSIDHFPPKEKTICVLGGTSPDTPSPIKRSGRSTRDPRRRIAQAIA